MSASYQFIPWTRSGAATGIVGTDPLDASIPARVALPVRLRVNDRVDVDVKLRMYGPGDVTGIDTLQIVRSDPAPWTTDFEPNYLPSIEFDRPDFPWIFTPAAADSEGRLRPWLCLVVVRRQKGVHIGFTPRQPLPVLTIESPAVPRDELPDLSESWAWCHSQVVTSPDGPSVEEHLREDTVQTVSRLVCPRRLESNTRYLACLVPAFAAGLNAGLGLEITEEDLQALEPAWDSGADAPTQVMLPLYHHWEFATGAGGDFESLVRQLKGRPAPSGVGVKPMAANDLGLQLPDAGLLQFDGVLLAPANAPPPVVPAQFQAALEALLNLPASQRADEDTGPIVAPPVYASWHASQSRIDSAAGWLRELNLNPWARAVAGLGTLVIQDQQEQLMAAAWEQLGELAHQRRVLEQPRFASAILGSVYRRRFSSLKVTQFFQLTAPAHTRLVLADGLSLERALSESPGSLTVRRVLGDSVLPAALTSAALRKVARPHSHLFRKINQRQARPNSHALMHSGQMVLSEIARHPAPRPVGDSVTRQLVRGHVTRLRGVLAFGFPAGAPGVQRQREVLIRMIDAAESVRDYFDRAIQDRVIKAAAPLELNVVKRELLGKLDPARTIRVRATARLRSVGMPSISSRTNAVAPKASDTHGSATQDVRLAGPSFPQPMYEALRDLSQEYLLPGAERIPNNTVTLLQTNAKFIEAYLVGLNHEMSRELLWREYPSDRRHTSFRRFWDDDGGVLPGNRGQIPALHQWDTAKALGEHFMHAASGQLVLLIRGELLLRYPNTLIHAVKAESRNKLGVERRSALFFGRLKPDMTFVGFDLTVAEARGEGGDPGWFFVIEQQPTEPRFGLDEARSFGRDPNTIGTWNDLTWGDLVETEGQLTELSHLPIEGRLAGKQIGPAAWARNGAHMAAITLQRPVRVAMHAIDLLVEEA